MQSQTTVIFPYFKLLNFVWNSFQTAIYRVGFGIASEFQTKLLALQDYLLSYYPESVLDHSVLDLVISERFRLKFMWYKRYIHARNSCFEWILNVTLHFEYMLWPVSSKIMCYTELLRNIKLQRNIELLRNIETIT